MCGIICIINPSNIEECLIALNKLKHRGPDDLSYKIIYKNGNTIFIGFTRLEINGLGPEGMQPFEYNNTTLVCNGEIYNSKFLSKHLGSISPSSDCGSLPILFSSNSFKNNIEELDAEFALIYVVNNTHIYAARDRFGVRPLFIGLTDNIGKIQVTFSSEIKAIPKQFTNIKQIEPSHYYVVDIKNSAIFSKKYYDYIYKPILYHEHDTMKNKLIEAVRKRLQSDRPLGFLLSGGLDSSLVVLIASQILKPENIVCFTIGVENSPDIIAAQELTKYLKIDKNHHIIKFDINQAIERIPEVIKAIETYDITTIRASVPQYILGEYIKNNTDVRVLLSGEGSDEIHGSYKYFKNSPNEEEFQSDRVRLLSELCYFDNLRTDRTMAAWGLEVRCPYLDHDYVEYIMSILVYELRDPKLEKQILRDLFKGSIPDELLYRPKDAFSDSVSSDKENWRKSIISYLENNDLGSEKEYYKKTFLEYYPHCDGIIPHYWLPRWCGNIEDPSATLI